MEGSYWDGMQEGMNALEREKEVVISKLIPAARESVWRAWTEGPLLARWWGPNGVTIPEATLDPKVGGHMRIVMLAGPELGPERWGYLARLEQFIRASRQPGAAESPPGDI